jgi:hypothetical protein
MVWRKASRTTTRLAIFGEEMRRVDAIFSTPGMLTHDRVAPKAV